ncbi:MAG: iron-sulfur cluster repair di-iron protein, ric [Clostridiales bacterium]|jgi:iron-sulfur cluster repair protein YtfE (RIC family)|nr:iron-sulfur cluster repair di-iron protein, ric [Clostridiales bacterium]
MSRFTEIKEMNLKTLEQYVPIVDRVHGASHPEFHDVRKVFEEINLKLKNTEEDIPSLDDEFKRLRKITNNYTVPDDVCESYEAVYNMLSELDKAYHD